MLKDMAPMLIMLSLTAVVGLLILRAVSGEIKKWEGGRYYRYYQICLALLVVYYCFRIVWVLTHPQSGSHP